MFGDNLIKTATFAILACFIPLLISSPAVSDFAAAKRAQGYSDLKGMYEACKRDADAGEAKCLNVMGVLYKIGRGGAVRDPARAAAAFEKSCNSGYWKGCANLGGLYASGAGGSKDPSAGAAFIEKAYGLVPDILSNVHPSMLVRAAKIYLVLAENEQRRGLEGYLKYMGMALNLKASVYTRFDVEKSDYIEDYQEQYGDNEWFLSVVRLRENTQKEVPSASMPALQKTSDATGFRDCPSCPEMVSIPPGAFSMGDAMARPAEATAHRVTITAPIAVGRFEVSFADWDQCVSDGGCLYRPDDKGWGRGQRPVINVSLDDAIGYIKWLSSKTGKIYRLPSEAEWEYLARGGNSGRWPWGDGPDSEQANCKDCSGKWAGKQTAPVGSFPANGFALHDAIGNVWEMTRDCKNPSYEGAPVDGNPWLTGDCSYVMVRGGSWDTPNANSYVAVRNWMATDARHELVGFRVVRELGASGKLASQTIQSAGTRFGVELVDCAALGEARGAGFERAGKIQQLLDEEKKRDRLLRGAGYFLGQNVADQKFQVRQQSLGARYAATGGQSSKLAMLGRTCDGVLENPASRYAYWKKKTAG